MPISIGDALSSAFTRAGNICFRPFNLGKWFVMGFCAFLSTCGEGGFNFNGFDSFRGGGGGGGGGPNLEELWNQVSPYMALVIAAVVILFLLSLAVGLAITYLRCRGRFMLLDNIMLNRAAVREPWHYYGPHAKSYFLFELALMLASFALFILAAGIGLAIAMPDIMARAWSPFGIAGIAVGGLILLIGWLTIWLAYLFAYDFVVPIMMIRNTTFKPAWQEARETVIRGHIGALILFYLLKIVLSIAAAILATLAICATCCIGSLPYLSSVLLLPILVFNRVFALSLLEQFHPDYRFVDILPPTFGFPVILDTPPDSPDTPFDSSPDDPSDLPPPDSPLSDSPSFPDMPEFPDLPSLPDSPPPPPPPSDSHP